MKTLQASNPAVQVKPATQSTADADSANHALDACPRCEAKLIDASGLGWCKKCGYCKSLEDDKARAPVQNEQAQKPPSFLGLVEFFQVAAMLPTWVWVLIGGVAMVVAINVLPSRSLPSDSLARAAWSGLEIICGVLMILAAQAWALFLLAPDDDKLSFKDAIIPGKLWGLTLKKLPETKGQVCLASWGLACILSAVTVLGGFSYWMGFLPKQPSPPPAVEQPQ